jgi:hypothetical protein
VNDAAPLSASAASVITIFASSASNARQPAMTMGWSSTIRTRVGSFAGRSFAVLCSGPDQTAAAAFLIPGFPCLTSCVRNKTSQIRHAARSYYGIPARRKAGRRPFVAQVFATGNEVVEAQPLFAMSLRSAM